MVEHVLPLEVPLVEAQAAEDLLVVEDNLDIQKFIKKL